MNIDRIKTAVEFLKDGGSFNVEGIRLGIKGKTVTVTGWPQYSNIENLTKNQSLRELEGIKDLFIQMVEVSQELKTFILNKNLRFNFCFDDYGKGGIIICSEEHGKVKWYMDLRQT